MPQIQNVMEVFKHLDKSNCRKCNEATCLAFASAVFKGTRHIGECPTLDREIVASYGGGASGAKSVDQEGEQALARLQQKIGNVDFNEAAKLLGGVAAHGKFTFKIMGKEISVDANGKFYTDLHVHAWLAVPVLMYILESKGKPVSGNWVPLRELEGGQDWYRLFGQRCEKPLKKVADSYTELFTDMVDLFNGQEVGGHFESDISVVLHPLPLMPLLICYWKPDDGLESDLHLFFDDTAEDNLNIESIYTLGAGLTLMFEKIAQRHG